MRISVYSAADHDRVFLEQANAAGRHELDFLAPALTTRTAHLARGSQAVSVFVDDTVNEEVLGILAKHGIGIIALRCTGYDNVDLEAAKQIGIRVVHVPDYPPQAVAEHAAGLILSLNRRIHRAYNRTRSGDYTLAGMMGFDSFGKSVAVVGTGRIGTAFARIMVGFGCKVMGYSPHHHEAFEASGGQYGSMDDIGVGADIVSLHCPLTPDTHHLINKDVIRRFNPGAILINTARGALVDSRAVIPALRSGQLGGFGMDVYEHERGLYFANHENDVVRDDVIARLLSMPNVIITGHQAWFTRESMTAISQATLTSFDEYEMGRTLTLEL